jgi:cell fate (sporulation/competence/biofilm development) regulator YlbF (YheA/YmcA/DUF963 family)
MSDTAAILDAADRLGRLIADHPATQKFDGILKKLKDDTDAQRLLTDLNRHRETLAEKQQAGQPIEVEDKRKMESLQQSVATHELLRDLQMAEMDYVDLMRKVDEKLRALGVPGR